MGGPAQGATWAYSTNFVTKRKSDSLATAVPAKVLPGYPDSHGPLTAAAILARILGSPIHVEEATPKSRDEEAQRPP